jgi:hypothetical protein
MNSILFKKDVENRIDKLIVADISPTLSPSLANIHQIIDKITQVDLGLLGSNIFKARKLADQILCELDILKNVNKHYDKRLLIFNSLFFDLMKRIQRIDNFY